MSSKQEILRQTVRPLIHAALDDPAAGLPALDALLQAHSALPGPRGNLELIYAVADEIGALCADPAGGCDAVAPLLRALIALHPPESFGCDAASPLQMATLCGTVALGEWAAACAQIAVGAAALFELADSPLWRVREAVAMGFQRLLARAWPDGFRALRARSEDASALQWRAIVAAVAEPALLREPDHAADALALQTGALDFLRGVPADRRRDEAVRTLRQALGYTLSVIAAAAPESGFALLRACAAWGDPDVAWVVRENLTKKRLGRWPDQVAAVRAALEE